MQEIFERVAGVPLGDLFDAWIRSPSEIDCAATLAHVGCAWRECRGRTARPARSACARAPKAGGRSYRRWCGRLGWRAGVDAGDELIAIGGVRLEGATGERPSRPRARRRGGRPVARDGRIRQKRAVLDAPRHDKLKLRANPDAPAAAREAFAGWLGEPHPAGEPRLKERAMPARPSREARRRGRRGPPRRR